MWIDADFPEVLGYSPTRPKPMLFVEGRDVTYEEELEMVRIQMSERVQARKDAALRSMAQLSAQHPLTGYDRNVLQQWIDSGAAGKRPELSFEISGRFKSSRQLIEEHYARQELSRQREAAARKLREELNEKKKLRSRKTRETKAEWDGLHPVAAKVRDERRAVVKERRAAARRQRQLELQEEAQVQKVMRIARDGGKGAVLQLNEEDFDRWLRHASTEALDAFGEDLLKDGKKLRQRDRKSSPGVLAQLMRWLGANP